MRRKCRGGRDDGDPLPQAEASAAAVERALVVEMERVVGAPCVHSMEIVVADQGGIRSGTTDEEGTSQGPEAHHSVCGIAITCDEDGSRDWIRTSEIRLMRPVR